MSKTLQTTPPTVRSKGLKKVAGPMLLWGIAVGAVISGDYYGWNSGLDLTGYWGFLVALGVMGVLYLGLSFVIAELGSAIPHSGGAYAYVRTALGRFWAFIAGGSVVLQFIAAPIAVALTTGAYVQVLFPDVPVLLSAAVMYVGSSVLHLFGAGGSLKVEFVFTAIAVLGLLVFIVIGFPHVTLENLNAYSGGAVFPHGFPGLWATLPLAAWFFFAIESLPMAAEETRNPVRDIPKALVYSFITLAILGFGTLTIAAGVGDNDLPGAAAPLVTALQTVVGSQAWITPVIALFSIASLIASFHAIVLAYSRQTFALARAGYLPRSLSHLNRHRTPVWGVVAPGVLGFIFVVIGDRILPDAIPVLVTLSVLFAAVSYALMILSALVLRAKRPEMPRPFRTPGGRVLMVIALALALLLIPAALAGYVIAFVVGAIVYALLVAYYLLVARRNLTEMSAEEELSLVELAEQELQ